MKGEGVDNEIKGNSLSRPVERKKNRSGDFYFCLTYDTFRVPEPAGAGGTGKKDFPGFLLHRRKRYERKRTGIIGNPV